MSDWREAKEDREAELGYQESSLRETRMREWWSNRDNPSKDKEFASLVKSLQYRRWAKSNPSKRAESNNRYRARNAKKVQAWSKERMRRFRARKKREALETVYTCAAPDCGVQWCRAPWMPLLPGDTHFCRRACRVRTRRRSASHTRVNGGAS